MWIRWRFDFFLWLVVELMADWFFFPAYPPGPLSSPAVRKGGANSHIWFCRFGYGTTGRLPVFA